MRFNLYIIGFQPGNVKLRPEILGNAQDFVAEKLGQAAESKVSITGNGIFDGRTSLFSSFSMAEADLKRRRLKKLFDTA